MSYCREVVCPNISNLKIMLRLFDRITEEYLRSGEGYILVEFARMQL